MSTAAARLGAVRFPLGPGTPIDPFALAGSDGIVFCADSLVRVGLGVALTLALPGGLDSPEDLSGVSRALRSIPVEDHVDRPGGPDTGEPAPGEESPGPGGTDGPGDPATSGVVALGSLPFDRSAPSTLTVPAIVYGVDPGGSEWVTLIGEGEPDRPAPGADYRAWLLERAAEVTGALGTHGADPADPAVADVVPRSSDDSFRSMVSEALAAIRRGVVSKVVLARQVEVTMDRPVAVPALLRRWHGVEPNCAVFSVPTPGGQFLGASPELLVERSGTHMTSRPLAGTSGRSGVDGPPSATGGLLASVKDGNEHRLVVEAIERALDPLCDDLEVPDHPALVHLHTITHLGTTVTGTLTVRADGSVPSSLDLVAALHPTPAVGGVPAGEALALIERLEPQSRGHYAGPVGYVDANGDGLWMLGIRSMTVRGARAVLAAGVGIVEGSEPQRELEETELKLSAVFDALAPGQSLPTAAEPDRRRAAG